MACAAHLALYVPAHLPCFNMCGSRAYHLGICSGEWVGRQFECYLGQTVACVEGRHSVSAAGGGGTEKPSLSPDPPVSSILSLRTLCVCLAFGLSSWLFCIPL